MTWKKISDIGTNREPGGQVDFLTLPDGIRLRTAHWPSREDSRGIVILVNGYREYLEKYHDFMEDILNRNFALYSFDHRGQGLSDRLLLEQRKNHVDRFESYINDLNYFIRQKVMSDSRLDRLPLYLLGHSMGGHICLRYLHDFPGVIDKAVLMAPLLGIHFKSPLLARLTRWIVSCANRVGLSEKFAPGQDHLFSPERHARLQYLFSHDKDRYGVEVDILAAHPALYTSGATYGWLAAAVDSLDKTRDPAFLKAIKTPTLAVLAGAERVVDNQAIQTILSGHDGIQVDTIDGARHEIYRESDTYKDQLWRKIDAFLS